MLIARWPANRKGSVWWGGHGRTTSRPWVRPCVVPSGHPRLCQRSRRGNQNRLAMLLKLLASVTLLVLSATACGSEADQAVEPVEPTAAETVDTESLANESKQQLEAQTGRPSPLSIVRPTFRWKRAAPSNAPPKRSREPAHDRGHPTRRPRHPRMGSHRRLNMTNLAVSRRPSARTYSATCSLRAVSATVASAPSCPPEPEIPAHEEHASSIADRLKGREVSKSRIADASGSDRRLQLPATNPRRSLRAPDLGGECADRPPAPGQAQRPQPDPGAYRSTAARHGGGGRTPLAARQHARSNRRRAPASVEGPGLSVVVIEARPKASREVSKNRHPTGDILTQERRKERYSVPS